MNNAVMFGKATDEWRTPVETFNALNAEFGFDVDAAATAKNSWVDGDYFGPDHYYQSQRDALTVEWLPHGKTFWLNPPYSKCRAFIAKAAQQARNGCTVVCLVPSRTDTRWWAESVMPFASEIRFVKGRLKFSGAGKSENSAPFPSAVIVFRPPLHGAQLLVSTFARGKDGVWRTFPASSSAGE